MHMNYVYTCISLYMLIDIPVIVFLLACGGFWHPEPGPGKPSLVTVEPLGGDSWEATHPVRVGTSKLYEGYIYIYTRIYVCM